METMIRSSTAVDPPLRVRPASLRKKVKFIMRFRKTSKDRKIKIWSV